MNSRIILWFFFIVSVIEVIASFARLDNVNVVVKPMVMLSLGAWYVFSTRRNGMSAVVLMGIILSLAGDVLLMFPGGFVAGLSAFLAAHIFYILAYRRHRSESLEVALGHVHRLRIAFPILLAGTGLVVVLYPVLGDMRIPVIIYAIVITSMVLSALYRYGRTSAASFGFVMAGAVLFMISDSILAINRFLDDVPNASGWVMLTYISAQYLIIRGLVIHPVERDVTGEYA